MRVVRIWDFHQKSWKPISFKRTKMSRKKRNNGFSWARVVMQHIPIRSRIWPHKKIEIDELRAITSSKLYAYIISRTKHKAHTLPHTRTMQTFPFLLYYQLFFFIISYMSIKYICLWAKQYYWLIWWIRTRAHALAHKLQTKLNHIKHFMITKTKQHNVCVRIASQRTIRNSSQYLHLLCVVRPMCFGEREAEGKEHSKRKKKISEVKNNDERIPTRLVFDLLGFYLNLIRWKHIHCRDAGEMCGIKLRLLLF